MTLSTTIKKPIAMRKNSLWAYRHGKTKKIDDTQFAQFAALLWEKTKHGDILSNTEVASLIQRVNPESRINGVKRHMLAQWISRARGYFVRERSETIIFVPKKGYKLAQGAEKPLHAGKVGHMALKWKYRFLDCLSILSIEDFKTAGAEIIRRIEKEVGGQKHSQEDREAIFELCKEKLQTLRLEAYDVKK